MREIDRAAKILDGVRARKPLVMCLTNDVASAFTADVLSAVGACPAMVKDGGEALQFAQTCEAGLINPGTVTKDQGEAMRAAVTRFNALKRPWVLDPVAFGQFPLRTFLCKEFMRRKPTIIRGNAAEIAAMTDDAVRGRGTDAGTLAADPNWAERVSEACLTTVLMTGADDYVVSTDPVTRVRGKTLVLKNGHPLLARTVGTGCAQGALAAACAAVPEVTPFEAALAAAVAMAVAGERAASANVGFGSYRIALLDALGVLTAADLTSVAKASFLK